MFRTSKRRSQATAKAPLSSGATGPTTAAPVAPPGESGGATSRANRRDVTAKPVVPSWQSTLVGLALLAGVLVTFAGVTSREGIEAGLQSWAALGPLVGIVTGAMTTYFFTAQGTANERTERLVMQQRLSREQHARLIAESRLHLIMGLAGDQTVGVAAAMSPGLFGDVGRSAAERSSAPGTATGGAAPTGGTAPMGGTASTGGAARGLPASAVTARSTP